MHRSRLHLVLFASLTLSGATRLGTTRRGFVVRSLSTAAMAPAAALLPLAGPSRAAETTFASPANAASGVVLTSQQTARTEFISGLIAGAAQKTIKEIVLHPLDTVKCRLQVASPSRRSLFEAALYEDAYSGIAPALISGAPAASVFFAVKDAVKQQLTSSIGSGTLTTLVAVACANGPYWVVRNPTEVIKARRQAGQVDDSRLAAVELWKELGPRGFYRGYTSNLAYAFPVDASKFVIYDAIKTKLKAAKPKGAKLSPLEAAVGGAFASAAAQAVSTPLDVARTRIMTARADEPAKSVATSIRDVAANEGIGALYAGVAPKVARAIVSGGLQFSVLEGVKDAVNAAILGSARTR